MGQSAHGGGGGAAPPTKRLPAVRRGTKPRGGLLSSLLLTLLVTACATPPAPAGLRVATSGDYAPFSFGDGGRPAHLDGLDVAIARRYAADRDLEIEWVSFRWPDLLEDLEAGRFDVAMSGITVRPERSVAGRFSLSTAQSGAVLLVREPKRWRSVEDLDRAGTRIAVNAGGHLERVAREHLANAELVAIPDNAAVPELLLAGEVDAVVTDTLEAPHWAAGNDLSQIGPFTRDRKALLLPPDPRARARAADLDDWLLAREADGTLAELRRHYLGAGAGQAVAQPLPGLLASIDERLSLMPLVAEAKRRRGGDAVSVEVPEREEQVLRAAVAATRAAARRAAVPEPDEGAVRLLFRAQIEAAKSIQRRTLAKPALPEVQRYDLDAELRPALIRIGDRIAALAVALPPGLSAAEVRTETDRALAARGLSAAERAAIAQGLVALSASASTLTPTGR